MYGWILLSLGPFLTNVTTWLKMWGVHPTSHTPKQNIFWITWQYIHAPAGNVNARASALGVHVGDTCSVQRGQWEVSEKDGTSRGPSLLAVDEDWAVEGLFGCGENLEWKWESHRGMSFLFQRIGNENHFFAVCVFWVLEFGSKRGGILIHGNQGISKNVWKKNDLKAWELFWHEQIIYDLKCFFLIQMKKYIKIPKHEMQNLGFKQIN